MAKTGDSLAGRKNTSWAWARVSHAPGQVAAAFPASAGIGALAAGGSMGRGGLEHTSHFERPAASEILGRFSGNSGFSPIRISNRARQRKNPPAWKAA